MRAAIFISAIAAAPLALVVACSLGLDETLIGAQDAAAPSEGGATDDGGQPIPEAGGDAKSDGGGGGPLQGQCNKDSDCKSTSACVSAAHCDPVVHVCSFDVCVQPACKAAACDTMSNTCSVPTTYPFHSASFKVSSGLAGCALGNHCFAAAYPFVFVDTVSGVVAYNVADPSNPMPASVPIAGLPFVPIGVVGNGRRIFFIASPVGGSGNAHVAVAWLDVPGNPFATSFTATTVFLSYGSGGGVSFAFPAANAGLFLALNDSNKAFPTALLTPPVADGSSLTFFPSPGTATNAGIAGASGTRLVTYRWDGDNTGYLASFSFETGAATSNAQNAGEQVATAMGEVFPQNFITSSADGSVLWSAPSVVTPDGGPYTTQSARMTWLVADGNAASFDESAHVDVESYAPPLGYGASVAGPAVAIDAKRALVIAAAHENPNKQVSVQVASRAMSPATLVANKRYVLPVDIGSVGVAASNGFAYVLAADDPMNQSATVHVFAPDCDSP